MNDLGSQRRPSRSRRGTISIRAVREPRHGLSPRRRDGMGGCPGEPGPPLRPLAVGTVSFPGGEAGDQGRRLVAWRVSLDAHRRCRDVRRPMFVAAVGEGGSPRVRSPTATTVFCAAGRRSSLTGVCGRRRLGWRPSSELPALVTKRRLWRWGHWRQRRSGGQAVPPSSLRGVAVGTGGKAAPPFSRHGGVVLSPEPRPPHESSVAMPKGELAAASVRQPGGAFVVTA